MQITAIGFDLAKNVLQVRAKEAEVKAVVRRAPRRKEVLELFENLDPCLAGIEARGTAPLSQTKGPCARNSTFRVQQRADAALSAKPDVKRDKYDRADAAAIGAASTRPVTRFVPAKTAERQSVLMPHRTRALLVRRRTTPAHASPAKVARLFRFPNALML